MPRARPLLVPANPHKLCVQLRFDEALIEARESDTLATAMLAAGTLMSSRSAKYRRPRGAYCLSGDCGTCLVRVDGRPNVRACMTAVREGMRVSSQNSYKPKRLDPTALVDVLFPGGIDHHHLLIRPRIANQVMQEVARNLTGFGELPSVLDEGRCEHHEHRLPVLIIGAGAAGRAAAAVLARAGIEHAIVDRHDRAQLDAHAALDGARDDAGLGADESGALLCSTGVFGIYPSPWIEHADHPDDRALVAASERREGVERLHVFRPQHLLFAVGSRDPMLPFANNDLPGIVSARGLIRALRRTGAQINGRCVVVGEGPWAEAQREALDRLRSPEAPSVELVEPDAIERALGRDRIAAIECRGRKLSCALLAVAAPPAAAHELPAQAGAPLRFDGSGFVVVRDDEGRCGTLGGTTLWAAGDVAGFIGAAAAARDGQGVAEALLARLPSAFTPRPRLDGEPNT